MDLVGSDAQMTRAIFFRGGTMMAKATLNPIAYDHYVRGREAFRTFSREGVAAAQREFAEAIGLDPDFARAYGWLAYGYLVQIQEGWPAEVQDLDVALGLAAKGVELAPEDYYTHWNLATIHVGRGDFENAETVFEQARTRNPDDADMLVDVADMCSYQGKPDEAIAHVERAMSLKIPPWYYWALGFACFQARQYARAVTELKKMIDPPNTAYLLLAACKAKIGEPIAPEAVIERVRSRDPQWTPEHLKKFPFASPEDREHYLDALRQAGIEVPE